MTRSSTAAALALLSVGQSAMAANGADTWVGNTSTDWAGMNWTGTNNPPVSGDSLIFGADGTAGTANNNTLTNSLTSATFNIAGITFSSAAPAYTMTGNTFNLTAGITNNSGLLQTFSNTGGLFTSVGTTYATGTGGISLSGLTFVGGGQTTMVTGTGGLVISALTLNNGNRINQTFSGSGNVTIGSIAPGTGGNSTLTYSGTGILTVNGVSSISSVNTPDAVSSGTFLLASGGNIGQGITSSGTGTFTENVGGVLSGSGPVTQGSSTTMTLAGANTYTSATTVSAGTLSLTGSINASNATTGSSITVNGGAFNESSTGVLNGSGSGSTAGGEITLNAGTVDLQGANNTTGNDTVNGGTFTVDSTGGKTANVLKTNGVTLIMGGGTTNFLLSANATANTETLYQTQFTANTSSLVEVTQNGNTSTAATTNAINLGNTAAFSRNAGSIVDFGTLPTTTVLENTASKANTINGVLTNTTTGVAFATVGGGTNFASINATTGVIGTVAPVAGTYGATANVSVTGGDTPASGAGANTLTFAGTSGATLNLSGTNVITAGGILVTPSTTGATTITGGTIEGGAGRELVVINNEPNTAGSLTISSLIADNTSASALTIGSSLGAAGIAANPQRTVLTNANTFTGQTTLLSGTLNLSNTLALQSSTLQLNTGASLVFDSSVTANAFTLGGLSTNSAIALLNNATTPAPINLTVGGNNSTTTISGVLSGAGGSLTKVGTGTLSLTANDTYTGATTVTGGTLAIGSTTGITSSVAVGTGAFLSLSRNATESATIGASSIISGAGGLIENVNNPNQSITLDRPNTYTGPTQNPARGGFTAGIASTFDGSGNQLTGAFGVNSQLQFTSTNAVLALNGYANQVGSLTSNGAGVGYIVLGGLAAGRPASVLTIGGDNTSVNYQGVIAETANQNSAFPTAGTLGGSIVKIGTGDQTFSGSNLYAGATTIKGGILTVTTLTNGGVATTASAADAASTTLSVASTAGLVVGQSLEATGVAIGTPPTITAIGTNSVTLSAAQTIANGAALYFGNGNGLGISTNAAASLVLDGGTLQYTGAATSTNRLFTVGSTEAAGATGTLDASGTGALNFTGTGALAYGTGTGTRTLNLTGTYTGANTLSPTIGDNSNGPSAVSVTKNGAGSWTLAGANTYSGGTIVTLGTLTAANDAALGSATAATAGLSLAPASATTATVIFTSATPAIASLASSGAGTSNVMLGNGTAGTATALTVGGNGVSTSFGGVISDFSGSNAAAVGSLTKVGTGTLTLTGANTYTGGTTVNAGTLTSAVAGGFGTGFVTVNPTGTSMTPADAATLNTTGSIASTAVVTVNSNTATAIGTVNFNDATPTIGVLAGTGRVVLNNASTGGTTLTIGGGSTGSASSTFAGVISDGAGSGSLTVATTGTVTLSGANTYSGATTVNAGSLLINGSLVPPATPTPASSTVTVNANGTLGGGGMLSVASATVNGTLAPGTTVGATTGALTLNTTGGLTIYGTLAIGITGSGGTSLATNGALTLGNTSTLTVTGTPSLPDYTLATSGSAVTGTFGTFVPPSGYQVVYNDPAFEGGAIMGDIELEAVPEPSTLWAGALMLAGACWYYRRRRAC